MGFLDRIVGIFKKKDAGLAATATDRARSQQLAGRETGQSQAEQTATRGRMETEMDAQRERRGPPPTPGP
jgi:hypothetical protein